MKKFLLSLLVVISLLGIANRASAQSVLLNENFQSVASALPDGWSTENGALVDWKVFTEADANVCAYFEGRLNYTSGYSSLLTPWIDVPYAEYGLSFKYKNTGNVLLEVYVLSSAGFDKVFTNLSDNMSKFETYEVDLSPYIGQRIKVQFYAYSNEYALTNCGQPICTWSWDDWHGLYVDDIKINIQPACAPVNKVYTTELSSNYVSLVWGTSSFGADPSSYTVTIKDLDYNTIKEEESYYANYIVTDLKPNTSYYAYVRANCTATQQGVAAQSPKFKFTTDGASITVPHHQDFDTVTSGLPDGWRWLGEAVNQTYVQSSVRNQGLGKAVAITSPVGSSQGGLVSPTILHEANDMEITFAFYPSSLMEFAVGVMGNKTDMTTFDELIRYKTTASQTKKWNTVSIPTGGTIYGTTDRLTICIVNYTTGATLYVDDVDIHTMPACPNPAGLAFVSAEATTATIEWNSFGATSNMEIEVTKNGQSTPMGTFTTPANDNQYTITGLVGETTYKVRIRLVCPSGTTPWTDYITFSTACASVNTSWTESFESGTYPQCWSKEVLSTAVETANENMWFINTNSTYASAGSKSLAFYEKGSGMEGGSAAAITPAIVVPEGDNNIGIGFDMWRSEYPYAKYDIMINTKPTTMGAITLKSIGGAYSQYPTEATGGRLYTYEIPFPASFKGKEVYILFVGTKTVAQVSEQTNAFAPYFGYIDNIKIKEVDRCPFVLTNGVVVSDYGQNFGVVSWEDESHNSEYHFVYTLKNGSTVISTGDETLYNTTYGFYGLETNVTYTAEIQISAKCSGYESAVQNYTVSFNTQCAVNELPYNENFDSYTGYKNQNAAYSANAPLPACWSVTPNRRAYSSTNEAQAKTTWYVNKSYKQSGANSFCYTGEADEAYISIDGRVLLCLGQFNIPELGGKLQFSYYQINNNTLSCPMEVYAAKSATSISGAKKVGSFDVYESGNEGWTTISMTIDQGTPYIIFAAPKSGESYTVYIDDLSITEATYCPVLNSFGVGEVGVHDATVYIDDNVEYWEVAISTESDLSTAEVTRIENGSQEYKFTNLTPNVTYYAWARNICFTDNDSSEWVKRPITFTPRCEAFEITKETLFVDGFESDNIDECYIVSGENEIVRIDGVGAPQGTSGVAVTASTATTIKRLVNMQEGFYTGSVFAYSTNGAKNFSFTITNESGSTIATIYNGAATGEWTEYTDVFQITTAGDYYITLSVPASNAVDFDFLTIKMEDCLKPSSVIAANITKTEADIIVTAADGIEWQVKVSSTEINPSSATGNAYDNTVTSLAPIHLTGLNKGATYYVYARSVCKGNAYSDWTEVYSFNTRCEVVDIPMTETFEDANLSTFKCWTVLGNGTTERTTDQHFAGNASLHVLGSMIASPELNVTSLTGYTLNGYVYSSVAGTTVDFGIMLDPNDITTYEKLTTMNIKDANSWLEFNIDLAILADDPDLADWLGSKYFVIVPDGSVDFYLDNISLTATPSCGKPANVEIYDIKGSTAKVKFTSSAKSFKYTVKIVAEDRIFKTYESSENPFTLTGLDFTTEYSLEIAAVCQDGTTTPYLYAGKFKTFCDPLDVPWNENFEAGPAMELNNQCYEFHAEVYDGAKPYAITATVADPKYDVLSISGNYSLALNTNSDPFYMSFPIFAEPLTNLQVEYTYRYLLALEDYPSVELGVINGVGEWSSFKSIYQGKPSIAYEKVRVKLSDSLTEADDNKILCLRVYGKPGVRLSIDDIYVNRVDGCTNITSLATAAAEPGAQICTWEHATATEFEYELYDANGLVITDRVNAKSIKLTGLAGKKAYTFKVRAYCNAHNASDWATTIFTTMAEPAQLPYTTTFSDDNDNAQWSFENGNYSYSFFIGKGTTIGYSFAPARSTVEDHNLYLGYTKGGVNYWGYDYVCEQFGDEYGCSPSSEFANETVYAYRPIYLPKGRCNVQIACEGINNSSIGRVFLLPSTTPIVAGKSNFGIGGTFGNNRITFGGSYAEGVICVDGEQLLTDYRNRYVDEGGNYIELSPVTSDVDVTIPEAGYYNLVAAWVHVRVQSNEASTEDQPVAFSSIRITATACSRTTNASVAVKSTSATVNVTNSVPVDELTYRYSTTNDFDNATERTVQNGTQFTINDLLDNTNYYLWVIPTCAIGSGVEWYQTQFKTTIYAQSIPYSTGFESSVERSQWTLLNASGNNFVFTDDHTAIKDGDYALYISNDGTTYNYTTESSGVNYAYTILNIPAGNYNVEFDYKANYHTLRENYQYSDEDGTYWTENAETGPVFARVLLIPSSVKLEAYRSWDDKFDSPKRVPSSIYNSIASESGQAIDIIPLDGGRNLKSLVWQHNMKKFTVDADEEYRLVVMWVNNADCFIDENAAFNYYEGMPITIDNISIEEFNGDLPVGVCDVPELKLEDYSSTAVRLKTGNEGGFTTYYICKEVKSTPTSTAGCLTTTLNAFTISDLVPGRTYYIYAANQCTNGLTEWDMFQYTAPCDGFIKITPDMPYEYGFEDYEVGEVIKDYNCWSNEPATDYDDAGYTYFKAVDSSSKLSFAFISNPFGERAAVAAEGHSKSGTLTNTAYLEAGKVYRFSVQCALAGGAMNGAKTRVSAIVKPQTASTFTQLSNIAFNCTDWPATTRQWHELTASYSPTTTGLYSIGIEYISEGQFYDDYLIVDNFMIEVAALPAVSNLVASSSGTKISATWSTVSGADYYEVQIVTAAGDIAAQAEVTGSSWTSPSVPGAQTYTVRVRTHKGGDISSWANTSIALPCTNIMPPYALSLTQSSQSSTIGPGGGSVQADFAQCWFSDGYFDWNVGGWCVLPYNNDYVYGYKGGYYAQAGDLFQYNLYSPSFAIDKEGYVVKFYYTTDNTLGVLKAFNVGISVDGGNTICEQILSTNQSAAGVLVAKGLEKYVGRSVTIVARVVESVGGGAYQEALALLYDFSLKCYDGDVNNTVTLCQGDSYEDAHFEVYADELNAGDYHFEYYKVAEYGSGECDGLFSLDVTVGTTNTTLMADTICEGASYNKNGFVNLTRAGVYETSTPNASGCDDHLRLTLFVVPNTAEMDVTICEGERYVAGGQVFTETGSYVVDLPSRWGCDITTTIHLNVRQTDYVTTKEICEGSSVRWGGINRDKTGVYVINKKTSDGECDSNLILDLTVLGAEMTIDTEICQGGSIVINNQIVTEPGIYTEEIWNDAGCSTIKHYNVTYRQDVVGYTDDYACEGKEFDDWGYTGFITKDTELVFNTKTLKGDCDSTVYITVHYMETEHFDEYKTITEGETLTWNNDTYSVAGDYERTLINDYGCDSIVTLHLTVKPKPDPGQAVENAHMLPLTIAPNPIVANGSSFVSHQFSELEKNGLMVYVTTTSGQVVRSFEPATYPIEIDKLYASGVYYVRIVTGTGETYIGKLVVK